MGHSYKHVKVASDFTQELLCEYITLSKEIAYKSKDAALGKALLSECSNIAVSHVFSQLNVTVKTHKKAGAVVFRPIHAAHNSPFRPAMRWLSHCLKPTLKKDFLLKDTRQLVTLLNNHKFPKDVVFIKFDIKDFFLSGVHEEIVELSNKNVAESTRKDYISMCRWILGAQYVALDPTSESAWQVVVGSGMGLTCSPDLSNSTFLQLVEVDWAAVPSVQQQHGILLYTRYMDDGLIIAHNVPHLYQGFLDELARKGKFFVVEIESISKDFVSMLDIQMFKGPRFQHTGYLDYKVATKPTNISQPLLCSSSHSGSVHSSWPQAMLQRVDELCSSPALAIVEKKKLLEIWSRNNIIVKRNVLRPVRRRTDQVVRLNLNFDPVWAKAGLGKFLHEFGYRWASTFASTSVPKALGISWSNGGRHTSQILKSMHEWRHAESEDWRIWRPRL